MNHRLVVVTVLVIPAVACLAYMAHLYYIPGAASTYLCQVPYVDQWLAVCDQVQNVSQSELGKDDPTGSYKETKQLGKDDAEASSDKEETKQQALPEYKELDVYDLCMLHNKDEEKRKREGYRQHGFNEFVSEKIGPIRAVPDVRAPACKNKVYRSDLPKASVVMCFYNEAWSTLTRSIHSILRQTPSELLQEIILLDDNSSLAHLGNKLDVYITENFHNVTVIRSTKRLGLIRARMEAAKHATGQVLVFLDSHIEAGPSWLEPLLDRIVQDRKTVVVPVVDTIEAETFVYHGADLVRGGFTWSLLHNWEPLPSAVMKRVSLTAEPFITPTMPGGLFAMEKDYFYELGEYDAGMDIWGGENMEISFRIWQCGGRLEIVPCSRVGHVFRQFRPYSSPMGVDTAMRNAARVAEVWLDEYKTHFYNVRPDAKTMDFGDVSDRIQLRKRLKCHSFRWFLENIHPEQIVPGEKPKVADAYLRHRQQKKDVVVASGVLQHKPSGLCVSPETDAPAKGTSLVLTDCTSKKYKFLLTDIYQVKLADSRFCLETADVKGDSTTVYLMKCHSSGGPQTWIPKYSQIRGLSLFNPASGKCLSVPGVDREGMLTMDLCSNQSVSDFQLLDDDGNIVDLIV